MRPKRRRSPRTGRLLAALAATCAVSVTLVLYWPNTVTKPTAMILDLMGALGLRYLGPR